MPHKMNWFGLSLATRCVDEDDGDDVRMIQSSKKCRWCLGIKVEESCTARDQMK